MQAVATVDRHGETVFLEKISKFDPETATNYKIMFEAAIQKEHKKALKLGITKGKREGLQEGLKEGEQKRSIEIAKQMIAKGMEEKLICDLTGLTLDDLKKLNK